MISLMAIIMEMNMIAVVIYYNIMVKLGLIGAGYWGKNLIREFNKVGFLDTICEINPKLIEIN